MQLCVQCFASTYKKQVRSLLYQHTHARNTYASTHNTHRAQRTARTRPGYFYPALERYQLLPPLIDRCADADKGARKFACFAIGNAGGWLRSGGLGGRRGCCVALQSQAALVNKHPQNKPTVQPTDRRVPQRPAVRSAPPRRRAAGVPAGRRGGEDARQRGRGAGQPSQEQRGAVRGARQGGY